jgi:hypothetical protein
MVVLGRNLSWQRVVFLFPLDALCHHAMAAGSPELAVVRE